MSLLTLRSGATAHPEDSVLQFFTDVINRSGVKDLGASDHFRVVQRAAGANMSVDISVGRAFIMRGSSNLYPIRNTTVKNRIVTNNSSGNPRIDSVVLFVNLSASPAADGSGVVDIAVVAGTPSGSPTAPTDSAISTAIGAANPFIRLADISVPNAAAQITNAQITDRRVRFQTRNNNTFFTLTDGPTVAINLANGNIQDVTLGGNRTLTISNAQSGEAFILILRQDATGGRTVTWFGGIAWEDNVAPVLTPTANRRDIFVFLPLADGTYLGQVFAQNVT